MDERELRMAMDRAVAVEPPPMREEPVLVAGRHALRRRRAVRASAGSAAVVAAVAVGAAVVLLPGQGQQGEAQFGAAPKPSTAATSAAQPTNATATSGTQHDRGAALAAALDDLAPAGYGTPDDLRGTGDFADRPLKSHKVMSAGTANGDEVWNYAAGTPLTKGDGVGELLATVYSPGWANGKGCGLSQVAWDAQVARCTEAEVDGKRTVAVADVPAGHGLPAAQWAGYRHPDGTAVFVMQTAGVARSGRPALGAMPMTGQQLAALATDTRLKAG